MARGGSQRAAAAKRERSISPISDGAKTPPMIFPRRKAGQNKRVAHQMPVVVTYEILSTVFEMPLWKACKHLGICATAMKKVCRKLGIMKWPYKENHIRGKRTGKPGSPVINNGDHSEVASSPSTPPISPPSSSRRTPRTSRSGPSPAIVVRETSRRAAAAAATARLSAVVAAERKNYWSSPEASPSPNGYLDEEDEEDESGSAQDIASTASTPVLRQAAAPLQLQVLPERHCPIATYSPRGYQHQALQALIAPLQQQVLMAQQQQQQQTCDYEPSAYASSPTAFAAFNRAAPPAPFDSQGGVVNFDYLADETLSSTNTASGEEEWEFGSDAETLFPDEPSFVMEQDREQLFSVMSF